MIGIPMPHPSSLLQHDLPHRPAAGGLATGPEPGTARQPAATVVKHLGEDLAQRPVAPPPRMDLGHKLHRAEAVASDPSHRHRMTETVSSPLRGALLSLFNSPHSLAGLPSRRG
jgi:hypothetical protein